MSEAQEKQPGKNSRGPLSLRVLKKLLRVFVWLLGVLLGLFALAWLAWLIFFPDEKLRRLLEGELEKRLKVPVRVGNLSLEILSGLSLERVVLGPPPGFESPPLEVERLVVDYSLSDILARKLVVRKLLVDHPKVTLETSEGRSNLQAWLEERGRQPPASGEAPGAGEEQAEGFVLALEAVRVRDARLIIRTPNIQADLSGLNLTLSGQLGTPKQTRMRLQCHLEGPAGPNLAVILPGGGPAARLRGALGFALMVVLDGFSKLEASGKLSLWQLSTQNGEPGHRLELGFGGSADLSAGGAELRTVGVMLDGDPLLSASGGLAGFDRGARAFFRIHRLNLKPSRLAAWLQGLRPDMVLAGAASLEDAAVEGRLDGSLSRVAGTLVLHKLGVSMTGLRLRDASGKLQLVVGPTASGDAWGLKLNGELSVGSGKIFSGAARLEAARLRLDLEDGRLKHQPGGGWKAEKLDGTLRLQARRLLAFGGAVAGPRLFVDLRGKSLTPGGRAGEDWEVKARIRLGLVAGEVVFERDGDKLPLTIPGALQLELSAVWDPEHGIIRLGQLSSKVGEQFALEASGELDWHGWQARMDFKTKPFSLGWVLAALPPDLRGILPQLTGEMELAGSLAGPLRGGAVSLEEFPVAAAATVWLRGVDLGLPGLAFDVKNLSGRVQLDAGGPRNQGFAARLNLTAEELRMGEPSVLAGGVSLSLSAVGDLGEFSVEGRLGTSRLAGAGFLARPLSQAQLEFGSRIVGMKVFRLSQLKLELPSLGAELRLRGQVVRPPGASGWERLKVSGQIVGKLHSPSPVVLPGGFSAVGEAGLLLSLASPAEGTLSAQGKITLAGLDLEGEGFSLKGMQGTIPIFQLLLTAPVPGWLAGRSGKAKKPPRVTEDRSLSYEKALRPMKGEQQAFSVRRIGYQDLVFENLVGNLELAEGQLSLGSLRFNFLSGDILADAVFAFAPTGTLRMALDAEMSGVDLAGLRALSLPGSSDISGNLHLSSDWAGKAFSASVHLTQMGRSTLQAMLWAIDPKEVNPGVMKLRGYLERFKVSPREVSIDVRHGLLGMKIALEMGLAARAMASLVQDFEGETYQLKPPQPVGGFLSKYLGF